MHPDTIQYILTCVIALPLCTALLLAWSGSWRKPFGEATIAGVTASVLWTSFAVAIGLTFLKPTTFDGIFRYDAIAAVFTILTAFVTALTASFARRYLHGDSGFLRFYCFLLALAGGSYTAFSVTENLPLIAGWECVGLSSFLLIAYFYKRARPRDHAILVFACYRIGDAALMIACALAAIVSTESSIPASTLVICCIIAAAACKSAQLPFSFWLPRAMEGPTPSSAVFYGGVSIHLGCFLLLRTEPLWAGHWWAHTAIVAIGLTSLLYAWISGRTSSDVKTKLAYATISHIGMVFVEIGLGWNILALIHVATHALVRTPQLLLASSALADYLQERRTKGSAIKELGWENKLPSRVSWKLYRFGLTRGNLESWIRLIIVQPFESCVKFCNSIENFMERSLAAEDRDATTQETGQHDSRHEQFFAENAKGGSL